MKNGIRQFLAGLLAWGITSASVLGTLLLDVPVEAITDTQWWTTAIGGFLSAAAGWRTLLLEPRR